VVSVMFYIVCKSNSLQTVYGMSCRRSNVRSTSNTDEQFFPEHAVKGINLIRSNTWEGKSDEGIC
jgi:hypothetical protein